MCPVEVLVKGYCQNYFDDLKIQGISTISNGIAGRQVL